MGDTHGTWDFLFKKLDRVPKISDWYLIHVGDVGVGFYGAKDSREFSLLNEKFKARGIEFIAIRGNHDKPDYFDGSINLSNFKLLKDYTVLELNGEKWQFVGGAVSVDRKYRTEGRDYWRNEKFVFDKDQAENCDVLVCHTAPHWIGPACKGGFVQPFLDKDLHLYSELTEEREEVQKLFDICRPKRAFFGHFHRSETNEYHGEGYTCRGRILDILELYDYRNPKY